MYHRRSPAPAASHAAAPSEATEEFFCKRDKSSPVLDSEIRGFIVLSRVPQVSEQYNARNLLEMTDAPLACNRLQSGVAITREEEIDFEEVKEDSWMDDELVSFVPFAVDAAGNDPWMKLMLDEDDKLRREWVKMCADPSLLPDQVFVAFRFHFRETSSREEAEAHLKAVVAARKESLAYVEMTEQAFGGQYAVVVDLELLSYWEDE